MDAYAIEVLKKGGTPYKRRCLDRWYCGPDTVCDVFKVRPSERKVELVAEMHDRPCRVVRVEITEEVV